MVNTLLFSSLYIFCKSVFLETFFRLSNDDYKLQIYREPRGGGGSWQKKGKKGQGVTSSVIAHLSEWVAIFLQRRYQRTRLRREEFNKAYTRRGNEWIFTKGARKNLPEAPIKRRFKGILFVDIVKIVMRPEKWKALKNVSVKDWRIRSSCS